MSRGSLIKGRKTLCAEKDFEKKFTTRVQKNLLEEVYAKDAKIAKNAKPLVRKFLSGRI